MVRRNFTIDDNLAMKASGAVAASAASALILDLGDGLVEGNIVIDVTAIDIVGNDEMYDVVAQLSPDAAFGTAGNIAEKCAISLGAKETKRTDCDKDDVIGRYILPFDNCINGTIYRYARLYTVCVGATASITYAARLCKD
jgi:hypothetical protein